MESRRNALKTLALGGLFINGMGGLLANDQKSTIAENWRGISPFHHPALPPLEAGEDGMAIRTLVKSSQTNNQISCVECAVGPRKMGPAPHTHEALDEMMLVLEGTASVLVGDQVYHIEAGGWHMRPRKLVHTFWNGSDKPLRFIDFYPNQDFDIYLEEIFHEIGPKVKKGLIKYSDPEVVERMKFLHSKYGMVSFRDQKQAIIDKYNLID